MVQSTARGATRAMRPFPPFPHTYVLWFCPDLCWRRVQPTTASALYCE
uniref:Uncharacterized protein n=1 Tax=Arundo donax TaxID=35708 RepID=A0A0A9G875_ARUDO